MKLLIDGQESGWKFSPDRTLEDVVGDVNGRLVADERRVVIEVRVEGYDDSLDGAATWDKVEIGMIDQLILRTESLRDNLTGRIDDGISRLENIRGLVGGIIDGVTNGRMDLAGQKLKETAENLLMVFDMIYLMGQVGAADFETMKCGDGVFPEFREKFNGILKDIIGAMENNDATLIKDFLEYEFEPAVGDLLAVMPEIKDRVAGMDFD